MMMVMMMKMTILYGDDGDVDMMMVMVIDEVGDMKIMMMVIW
jgi:hypothetical protein